MNIADFKHFPQRVWINNPSTLQPHNKLHGKVGIAVLKVHSTGYEEISIYFTEGEVHSMVIDPMWLAKKFG
jgi:hypothetical protein